MRIGYQLYEFTSSELKKIIKDIMDSRDKMFKASKKFAKKHGADTDWFMTGRHHGGQYVCGFAFKKNPDEKLWRKVESENGHYYRPKKNTKASKAIHEEFKAIPDYTAEVLAKAINWQNLFHDCRYYELNLFVYEKLAGIQVPVFDEDAYKSDPKLEYKPIKGMKELSIGEFRRRSA